MSRSYQPKQLKQMANTSQQGLSTSYVIWPNGGAIGRETGGTPHVYYGGPDWANTLSHRTKSLSGLRSQMKIRSKIRHLMNLWNRELWSGGSTVTRSCGGLKKPATSRTNFGEEKVDQERMKADLEPNAAWRSCVLCAQFGTNPRSSTLTSNGSIDVRTRITCHLGSGVYKVNTWEPNSSAERTPKDMGSSTSYPRKSLT